MPPFARHLITLFIGAPAAAARFLGVVFTLVEGTVFLGGMGDVGTPLVRCGLHLGHPATLAAAAFSLSILGYWMEVLLAYITAENRQALPPREVAKLSAAELGIQSLTLIGLCLLGAATWRQGAIDHHRLYFGTAGGLALVSAGFLLFRFHRRIHEWRQAWQKPPAAQDSWS